MKIFEVQRDETQGSGLSGSASHMKENIKPTIHGSCGLYAKVTKFRIADLLLQDPTEGKLIKGYK